MNFLILKLSRNSYFNNITKYLDELVIGLSKKNIHAYLITKENDSLKENFEKREEDVKVFKNFVQPTKFTKSILFLILSPVYFIKILYYLIYFKYKKNCKVLYCIYLGEKLLATVPARIFGYKVIWLEHTTPDYFLKNNIYKNLFLLLSKLVTIIAVSNHIKIKFEKYWIKTGEIQVIYPGINTNTKFKEDNPYYEFNKRFVLGTISRLEKNKGVHLLLKAVEISKQFIPDVQLIIVGKGPEKKTLLWLAKTLGIEENVRIVNEERDFEHWISRFDVFVMPDIAREAFAFFILQAMAYGKPVIIPKVDGIFEVVEQNETGYIILPNDSEMLSQAFINFYNNQAIMEPMGRKAKKRVDELFNIEDMLEKYYKILIS